MSTSINSSIVYFTASYPYGLRETYLHNEILIMSQHFDYIYIVPTYNPSRSQTKRSTPSNVVVFPPVVDQGMKRVFQGLLNLSPTGVFINDFFRRRVYLSSYRLRKWFNSMLVFRISYYKLKKIVPLLGTKSVLYSYWAEAPLLTTKLASQFPKVVRMHGGDFYLDRNQNYLPARSEIYRHCDLLLPISKDIRHILISDYQIDSRKIFLNYLGTFNYYVKHSTVGIPEFNDKLLVLVSCSNVYKLKRVNLIIDIIQSFDFEFSIEWHHFGDGDNLEMETLKTRIQKMQSDRISVVLHGYVSQDQLYDFYKNKYVHWFINTSRYEGVPVSIMEAFSFGIPAIATDVGATREIVNDSNGYLISPDFDPKSVAFSLMKTTRSSVYSKMRNNAYETWKSNFSATVNYAALAKKLMSIKIKN